MFSNHFCDVVNMMLAQRMMANNQMPAGLSPQQQQQHVKIIFRLLNPLFFNIHLLDDGLPTARPSTTATYDDE